LQLSARVWKPSEGQSRAVEFLTRNGSAALWADPGAGKTSIALTAFSELQKAGVARKMLVVAPLRVCQLQWRQEAAKWEHTEHLKVVLVHGEKKARVLNEDADVYLINYEGLPWLCERYRVDGLLPFDTIVADEITRLKNAQTERAKALRKVTQRTPRKWGLTGTPAPNGYLDLFGQFLWLDGGASLGKYFSHYKENFFKPSWDGFGWDLQKGGEERITAALKDIVLRLSYTDLPAIRDNDIKLQMDPEARKKYDEMAKEALVDLPAGMITASNQAAVYSKLKQMANGAVYLPEVLGQPREWVHLHDAKLDALVELIESLQGQPLLVAYQFRHDLERIQVRLKKELGIDVPFMGAGVSEKRAAELQTLWNANKLPVMLCHPASVGHGLNFQEGGAGHLCWFSCDFNLELYEQFIRRIRRQGNPNERIVNHRLIVEKTLDEEVFAALEAKDTTQARLLHVLQKSLGAKPPQENDMQRRLMTQAEAQTASKTPTNPPAIKASTETGKPLAGWTVRKSPTPTPAQEQQTAIQSKLKGEPTSKPPPTDEVEKIETTVPKNDEDLATAAQTFFDDALNAAPPAEEDADVAKETAPAEAAPPKTSRGRAKKEAVTQETVTPQIAASGVYANLKDAVNNPGVDYIGGLGTAVAQMAPQATVTITFTGTDAASVRRLMAAFLG
jgi:hypothetical protein